MNYAFHEHFMRMALREADKAAAAGEVPTGCVIIADPGEAPACLAAVRVLGRAHNQTEMLKDPRRTPRCSPSPRPLRPSATSA